MIIKILQTTFENLCFQPMRFDCKEILISDEEFGCSISFSEKENGFAKEHQTVEELLHATGQYVMLMRK